MDIKSLILIGGGLMIAAVVVHGFWIAWRARREPLRMNIVPDLIPDDYDESARFRGELPNGGARVKRTPEQRSFDLDEPAPLLMEQAPASERAPRRRPQSREEVNEELFGDVPERAATAAQPTRGPVHGSTPASSHNLDHTETPLSPQPQDLAQPQEATERPVVREVRLEPEVTTQRRRARRLRERVDRAQDRAQVRTHDGEINEKSDAPRGELIVVHVLAHRGEPFQGPDIVAALRAKSLRYGEMNIFHRIDTMSKVTQYSVANAVEPGIFDLSDVQSLRSPGLTFFLRLPGPDQATEAFDDMWRTAQDVAIQLGGEVKDEHMSDLTAQTIEHYRERIAEFARRRLSMRA